MRSVHFQLDRTAPETSLPDVIDGIAWERGMHLQGTVQDNLSDVEVAYAIERASDGQSISQHSFTVTGSSTGTAFDQVISELAAGDSTLQAEEVYNLIVTSTDVAGNSQRTRFQFFVPGDRRVEDDDQWTEGGSTEPFSDPPKTVDPDGDDVQTWGKVGKDGNWGYYSGGGSGGGGGWTPGYNGGPLTPEDKEDHKEPTGSGYEFEYVESIDKILTVAVDSISTHPTTINEKAALNNRKNILLGIGERLATLITPDGFKQASDQALINRMELVMQGLFVDAFDSQGDKAGVYEGFEHWAGAWLAQELIGDALNSTSPTSVRVQVFQATLLDVVTEATPGVTDLAEQQALTTAVMELAKTYAWLNPNPEATVPAESEAFGFLDRLWRLQVPDANGQFKDSVEIATALQKGVSELGQLLDGVQNPVRAIQFINNLLQAATNTLALSKGQSNIDAQVAIHNVSFLRELIKFGFEVAQSDPIASVQNLDMTSGWIEILLAGSNLQDAAEKLNSLFEGLTNTTQQTQALELSLDLIKSSNEAHSFEWQDRVQTAEFWDEITNLSAAYVAARTVNGVADLQPQSLDAFLNDLWIGLQDNSYSQETLKDPNSLAGVLRLEHTLLSVQEVMVASVNSELISLGAGDLATKVAQRALKWLAGRDNSISKHIFTQHIARKVAGNTYFTVKGTAAKKLVERTLEKPDRVLRGV
ncbi:hypothetical protein K9N68_39300 (plasmid) [Kovacikia minuta CCNUW1]|uniref:hypothetical protein n=1 Tax=Kovacikia minuta TaxID=2931930 RepID=UPI001CCBC9A5|nr:hypothetical protein [Kovacikia minuta]UBF30185.1 hypothetical protein K9N68_39300 [Kovacikia minuta CCNUW1]